LLVITAWEIARCRIVPAVWKLVLAAEQIETLGTLPPAERSPWLDALLKKTVPAPEEH